MKKCGALLSLALLFSIGSCYNDTEAQQTEEKKRVVVEIPNFIPIKFENIASVDNGWIEVYRTRIPEGWLVIAHGSGTAAVIVSDTTSIWGPPGR